MAEGAGRVLELVVFELKDGASRQTLLETAEPVSKWISEQPGFVSRELCYDGDGERWIDVVWWHTIEDAKSAAERAMNSESCAPMFALIEMDSMLMLHGRLEAVQRS
jgi:hypothetical protein